jgi:hypothetical protein
MGKGATIEITDRDATIEIMGQGPMTETTGQGPMTETTGQGLTTVQGLTIMNEAEDRLLAKLLGASVLLP